MYLDRRISRYRRGELNSPSHDTDKFPYLWNNGAFLIHSTCVFSHCLNEDAMSIGNRIQKMVKHH